MKYTKKKKKKKKNVSMQLFKSQGKTFKQRQY